MQMKIAVAQIDSKLGDLEANAAHHLSCVEQAIAQKAQMIVFPELSLTGYSIKDMNWDLAFNVARYPKVLQPIVDASKRITILAGGIEEDEEFRLYNSAFMFSGQQIRSVHRKIYLPTYGMFEEMRYFSKGSSVDAVDTPFGKVGVLVCEDLWHMSLPYVVAAQGAHVIVGLVASPTRLTGNEEHLTNARVNMENNKAYARLLSSYVVFCNRVGYEDGVNFWGGSAVIGPNGEPVATAQLFQEEIIYATLDDHEVRRARRFSRHYLDEDPEFLVRELNRLPKMSAGPSRKT